MGGSGSGKGLVVVGDGREKVSFLHLVFFLFFKVGKKLHG